MANVIKTWNGIVRASLKTFDGIASASVKTINGLDAVVAAGGSPAIVASWKGSAGSASKAITVAPTAGNLVVVSITAYNGSEANHTVTDNIGSGTWVKVAGINNASFMKLSMWYQLNVPSGITTITVNGGASCITLVGIVHDVSGCSTTTPFTAGEFTTKSQALSTNPQTTTLTNATADSIFFAQMGNSYTSNGATLTVNSTGSSGTGTWNLHNTTNCQETAASTYQSASVANLITTASDAKVHGWTTNNASSSMIVACFHP